LIHFSKKLRRCLADYGPNYLDPLDRAAAHNASKVPDVAIKVEVE
jgi:hypothetical protein